MTSTLGTEARVKRVLDLHLDSSLLDHLTTLAHVFTSSEVEEGGEGAVVPTVPSSTPPAPSAPTSLRIPRTGAGLRVEIDRRTLSVAQTFLSRLSPLECELRAVSEAVDRVVVACQESMERAEQDERVSAAFLAAAADTARRKAVVQGDVSRLKEIAAQYTLSAEYVQALEDGPEYAGGAFFEALERVESIRTRALQMLSGEGPPSGGGGGGAGEHALGLELLESATAAQSGALSHLFEWCLARCRQADVIFSGMGGDGEGGRGEGEGGGDSEAALAEQREREAVLGGGSGYSATATNSFSGGGSGASLERSLRRGLTLLATFRPGFCRACQEAAVASRRGAFVRAFVTALSVGTGVSSGGGVGGGGGSYGGGGGHAPGGGHTQRGGGGGINASAHDSLRYVSDLCAWVHLHSAEETEAFMAMFKDTAAAAAASIAAAAVATATAGGGGEGSTTATTAATAAAAAAPIDGVEGAVVVEGEGLPTTTTTTASASAAESSRLLTSSEMVTSVCDGLARPLSLRVEQVVTSPSTPLPVAYRMTDVLAFYVLTLRGTLAPHSTLLAGLQDVHDRCVYRVEELLQVSARRLREAPPAYPSSLSLTPMVSDMVALLEDILQASSSSLLSANVGGGGGGDAGHPTAGAAHLHPLPLPLPSSSIDVAHLLETLVDPLLESCRASATGLRLLDTATFMCNQVTVVSSALAPYAASSRLVQRLAAELSAYEESMVAALSEEVLGEAGLLPRLTTVRSQPPGARLCELPGLRAGEVRACCASLVSELSLSPGLMTGGGGGGGGGGTGGRGQGPFAAFDRIDNPRVRSRLRRDASSLLYEAYSLLYRAVAEPGAGYGGPAGAADLLPSEEQMQVLLDLK